MPDRTMIIGGSMLCSAFLVHSIILLGLEPAMGFREFSDFFDLDKIVPALDSGAWFAGNLMHLLGGSGFLVLSSGLLSSGIHRPALISAWGFAAAPLYIIVGMSGFVGRQLLSVLPDTGERDAALLGMIVGSRTMVLYAAIFLTGGLLLALSTRRQIFPIWFRIVSFAAGAAALTFFVFPTPMPLVLLIWSASVLITSLKSRSS